MHNQPLADRLPILTTSDILMAISQKEPLMAVQTLPRPFDAGHGGAVYVPVAIPEDIDPAEVSSFVEAIQKAMVVLTHARQGDVTTRADRIAELASGLLEPSQELLEDRVHRMQTLHQVFATGDWLTSDQLHALQADPPKSKSQPASDWKRRGRVCRALPVRRQVRAIARHSRCAEGIRRRRRRLGTGGVVPFPERLDRRPECRARRAEGCPGPAPRPHSPRPAPKPHP